MMITSIYEITNNIPDNITNLYNRMNKEIEYGYLDYKNKKKVTDNFDNFWNNGCVLHPNEVWEYKIGTCWDMVLLEYYELNKLRYETFCYFLNDNEMNLTHTFLIFKYNNYYYYFESAWFKHRGIKGPFKSLNIAKTFVYDYYLKNNKINNLEISQFKPENILRHKLITCEIFLKECHKL